MIEEVAKIQIMPGAGSTPGAIERNSPRSQLASALFCWLLIFLGTAFSIEQQNPPNVVSQSTAPQLFSASAALKHVASIAQRPHPMGSNEHAVVRDYIVAELSRSGLEPQIQKTIAVNATDEPLRVGAVENIVARLKGTISGPAVLLVSHYDSMPNSLGASDDGAGAAALLETLRALKAGPALRNDVIFLFSDGEEVGLLGASAFVKEHPWASEVGVVFNFEARGNSGPSIMFETSDDNGKLIREFARAAPFPIANSLSYEIYKLLPNDTDLTIFRKAGMPGLNFAYINGLGHYHTPLDRVEELDERSLQHHGSYALALARHFGNLDLSQTKESSAVYFDLFGKIVVHYPMLWTIPLAALVVLLFIAFVIIGFQRGRLQLRGIVLGFLALLLSLITAAFVTTGLWRIVCLLAGRAGHAPAAQGGLYLSSFVIVAVALTSTIYTLMSRKVNAQSLATGGMAWWVILMLVSSWYLPGGSFLLIWPLCFSVLGVGLIVLTKDPEQGSRSFSGWVSLILIAVPGIVLLAPIAYQIFIGLTLEWTYLIVAIEVLLLGLLVPHALTNGSRFRWLVPGAAGLAGLLLFITANFYYLNDSLHPRQDNVFYGLNATTGKAVWASDAERPDEWTSQLLSSDPQRGTLPDLGYAVSNRTYLQRSASVASLPAPALEVLNDETSGGVRTLDLRLTSPRHAEVMALYVDSKAEVLSAAVDGKTIESEQDLSPVARARKQDWAVRIHGFPRQGLQLQWRVKTSEPLKLRLVDQSYGLSQLEGVGYKPRPNQLIPSVATSSDSIFLSQSFVF